MHPDDPSSMAERIGQRAGLRARFPGPAHPGPAALRMLRLLAAVFRGEARWRALALAAFIATATGALIALMVRFALWNADFFDAIEQKSWPGLTRQAWLFLIILGGAMVIHASALQARRMLQITLRRHITLTLIGTWMTDGRHARLKDTAAAQANEDGRIAEDGRVVCELVVDFLSSFLYAMLQFVVFVGMLWLTSGPVTISAGVLSLTIPGHMVWVALAYASLGAAITVRVGHPLVRATDRRQTAEAAFRGGLLQAVSHSSTIALARAEAGERRRLSSRFDRVRATWAEQTISFRRMTFLTAGFGFLTTALPLLLLAPRHFDGEMSLGTMMQVALAFGQVTAALFWMSDNYPLIAQWEASAARVLALYEAATDIGHEPERERPDEVERVAENGPGLTFRDVSLVSPAGAVLVSRFNAAVAPGERVLVEATPPAAAALFRAVAGLSVWGSGRIELPEGAVPFFIGEQPHLPEATLADILAEPRAPADVPRAEAAAALVEVGLASLIPSLGTFAAWEQELSIEDQQRLGIARALLHKPGWIFIHDATSALEASAEEEMMTLLVTHLPGAAIVTIAHRPAIEQLHQRRIALTRPPPAR
ncbi:ABC transporter ATP-binding protein/permease [Elioraea sp.]|uniref:ABC transporter ATP-binding protein/permease n=1 Tax=Elioraea sp. TaxID=2185103 RepID=UPI0025BC2C87|nr:SbmA/BacA-like family transporter [Elioraea sp.]